MIRQSILHLSRQKYTTGRVNPDIQLQITHIWILLSETFHKVQLRDVHNSLH